MPRGTRFAVLLLALVAGALPTVAAAAPAKVTVFEAEVHAAPDRSSPVIHRFAENARVSVSEAVRDGFRKIRLPDGKVGYVEANAVSLEVEDEEDWAPEDATPPRPLPPPPPYGRWRAYEANRPASLRATA